MAIVSELNSHKEKKEKREHTKQNKLHQKEKSTDVASPLSTDVGLIESTDVAKKF